MKSLSTHTEAGRKATTQTDGTWSGAIACDCGWTRMVTGRPNKDAVDLALHGTWVVHSFRA